MHRAKPDCVRGIHCCSLAVQSFICPIATASTTALLRNLLFCFSGSFLLKSWEICSSGPRGSWGPLLFLRHRNCSMNQHKWTARTLLQNYYTLEAFPRQTGCKWGQLNPSCTSTNYCAVSTQNRRSFYLCKKVSDDVIQSDRCVMAIMRTIHNLWSFIRRFIYCFYVFRSLAYTRWTYWVFQKP